MAKQVGPLNWNAPIVDDSGRPTREFITKWNSQAQVNAEVPDAAGAAAMSVLLDQIGATQGAILRRGSEQWQIVETPGGTNQFLRADGAYATPDVTVDEGDINLADVLTNNASTMRHGFLPKLSGDDSRYLDGSGQWSTPAGGGGGGGVGAWQAAVMDGVSGSDYATKGGVVTPLVDGEIRFVWTHLDSEVGGASYKATCWELVDVGDGELGDQIGGDVTWTGDGRDTPRVMEVSPAWTVSSGVAIVVLVTRTDGDADYALPVDAQGYGSMSVPFESTGPFFRVETTDPQTGDFNDFGSSNLMHGFGFVS